MDLFKKDMPPPPPKQMMPDEQDPQVIAAKRKALATAMERSGRASTMLSDSYSNDRLGGRA
jgi:hypothetical protein